MNQDLWAFSINDKVRVKLTDSEEETLRKDVLSVLLFTQTMLVQLFAFLF